MSGRIKSQGQDEPFYLDCLTGRAGGEKIMAQQTETGKETLTADIESIKQTVLDYIEAWYKGEPERGEKSLHPELAKRIVRVNPETGKDKLEGMSAETLVERWRSGDGKSPKGNQLKKVTVLDVHGRMASVKLEAAGWVDYMHLAKFNDEWVIINILWELKS
jgi:Putative lumazine-binding